MLTDEEIKRKIFELPDIFRHFYSQKNWPGAKHAYDTAVTVSVFAELEEEDMIRLFGSRAYRDDTEPTEGLFDEKSVQRAYSECIRKNQTYENKKYPGVPVIEK